MSKLKITIAVMSVLLIACSKQSPLDKVKSVADKIIRESTFGFETVKKETEIGMQVVSENVLETNNDDFIFAISTITPEQEGMLPFGISYNTPLQIILNDEVVFEDFAAREFYYSEVAYSMFDFQDTIYFDLVKGRNDILVKMESSGDAKMFLRELRPHPEDKLTTKFESYFHSNNETLSWEYVSLPKEAVGSFEANAKIRPEFAIGGQQYSWKPFPDVFIKKLIIDKNNSYKRESYLEWHYANGAHMFTLLNLSDASGDEKYSDFVKNYCDFTIDNYEELKKQYYSKHSLRGANYRIFRRSMLDDTGAPCLPFIDLYNRTQTESYKFLIDDMIEYVSNEQVRLEDGTFCRPEPTKWSLWADDLFMSIPFLLRASKMTNETRHYDDIARQIINFNSYLFDPDSGLYKHGWFSSTNETSKAFWGRANGWSIWAASEALLHLPEDHKDYDRVLNIFKKHIDGLVQYQSDSGLWHQVLNHPNSFLETSCSAMYVLAIARGVQNGWLDESYKSYAIKGWEGVSSNIMDDGTVRDICRGTGIGNTFEFYYERDRFDHDPRGLGAVITAGIEVSRLMN